MPASDPAAIAAIARDAYVYGFPMVDAYRILHAYFVDEANPEYKAPWNQLRSVPRVYTPDDAAIQTPNSDTPYSMLGMDLRAEPLVLTVPPIPAERYFSVQLVDAYTHNFDYLGSRTTGNDGGSFLIAGPGWHGEVPAGITKAVRAETELGLAIIRIQLFGPTDLGAVTALQAGCVVQPLSAFVGAPPPPAPPTIDFIAPLPAGDQRTSPRFFEILDFVLRFCPPHPSESELRERFAEIGVGAPGGVQVDALAPEAQAPIARGMAEAWADFADFKSTRVDTRQVTAGDLFGTREYLANNYRYRMAAAILGIFGNSKEEAIYPVYSVDAAGRPLDGSSRYTLRFEPDGLPPVHAFWSLTMYRLPESLLVANPIDRYLLNSPMLPGLRRDPDGGLTILVQHASPGPELEANWLPAPEGPFWMVMRLYWPREEAITGTWTAPPLVRQG